MYKALVVLLLVGCANSQFLSLSGSAPISYIGSGLIGTGLGYHSGSIGGLGIGLSGIRSVGIAAAPAISSWGGARAYGLSHSQALTPVNAAVISGHRQVAYRAVPNVGEIPSPAVLDVPPTEQPVHINFLSKSSPLLVSQAHIAGEPGQVQFTESEDEPHRLIHQVTKPVVQEVREVIQPYRQVLQEINPVIEQTGTIVTQGEGARLSGTAGGIVGSGGVIGQAAGLQTANTYGIGYGNGLLTGGIRNIGLYGSGLGYGTGLLTGGIRTIGSLGGLYNNGFYSRGLAPLYSTNAFNLGGLYNAGFGYQFVRRR